VGRHGGRCGRRLGKYVYNHFLSFSFIGLLLLIPTPTACFSYVVVTMVLTERYIVTLISMAVAPLAAYQKFKLNQLGGMRGQQNQLRASVNVMTSENNKLSQHISVLEASLNE
jgi:hypothetical protein